MSTSAAPRGFRRSADCARAASGLPRLRSRPASRCTASARSSARSTSAVSWSTRRSSTRWASTPGTSYKNTPFAWSPGTGKGAWGAFVNTPSLVTHGVGHPDWSHRSYVIQVDDDALDLFVLAADAPSGILDLYAQLTGASSLGAALESRSVGLACVLQNARGSGGDRSEAPRAQDPVRRADPRRAHRVGCRNRVRFHVGRGALSRSSRRARRDQGAQPARVRVGVPVRVGAFAAVRRARVAQLSADDRRRRSVRVRLEHRARS